MQTTVIFRVASMLSILSATGVYAEKSVENRPFVLDAESENEHLTLPPLSHWLSQDPPLYETEVSNEESEARVQLQTPELWTEYSQCEQPRQFDYPSIDAYRVEPARHRLHLECDLVALTYDSEDSSILPSNLADEMFSTGGFDARLDAGFEARVQYAINYDCFLEFSWLGDISISGIQERPTEIGIASLQRSGTFSNVDALIGHEIESPFTMPFLQTHVFGLAGFGGMMLDERLSSFASTSVKNRLRGVIGGVRTLTSHTASSFTQLNLLGGVFDNDARLTSEGSTFAGQSLPNGFARRRGTTFTGKVSVEYQYLISENFCFQAGYQVHWLRNVSLASDNFSRNLDVSIPAIALDGNAILHGDSLGLTWTL